MQKLRRGLGLVFVLVMLAVSAHMVSAAEKDAGSSVLSRIKKRGILIAGTSGSMPPFNMTTKDGKIIGLDADLAQIIAAAMDVKLELKAMDFAKLLPALGTGEVDMVLSSMTMTPERNMQFAFVGPYFLSGKSFLAREQNTKVVQAQTSQDINSPDVTLTALKGSTSQSFVEQVTPKAKFIPVQDYDEAVRLVVLGEADALVADYPFCAVSVFRYPDKGLTAMSKPLTYEPLGIAVPPHDSLLVNWLTNLLLTLEGGGQLEKLRTRWFRNGDWLQQLP
jgi:polar amino acid transport system substrate-binding protein